MPAEPVAQDLVDDMPLHHVDPDHLTASLTSDIVFRRPSDPATFADSRVAPEYREHTNENPTRRLEGAL
uniref:Uncharacterized protein n=1 Tax=Mycena chlorophos TaxID=658473 RepID=A0ABQ0LWG5_MYCCL|nr:predicted protein [Mycena chlorophos]